MVKVLKVCWQSWNGESTEHLSLSILENEFFASGTIVSAGNEPFIARYFITCDILWVTRKLSLVVERTGKKRTLELESDGNGVWASNSQTISSLCGAIDVDLSATPFTNTLPICRLNLKENQTQQIQVVYIMIPGLEISLKNQRYTCTVLNEKYLFEQPSDNFKQEIFVDKNGIVELYPKLFRRVTC